MCGCVSSARAHRAALTPDEDIFLDNIGIGEPSPSAPTLSAPAQLGSVNVVRPTLVVTNALDYQADSLFYRFEVYSDAGLANLVAQIPSVASGAALTAWQVDVNLPNNAQYWWRCRATEGTNASPWMATATFFVNEVNHPPLPVEIVGPPDGAVLDDLNGLLVWFPTTDPDEGDSVAGYQLQLDDDDAFASPEINVTNLAFTGVPLEPYWVLAVALDELAGSTNLLTGQTYHWRIRAKDNSDEYSD